MFHFPNLASSYSLLLYPLLTLLTFVFLSFIFSENKKEICFKSVALCFFWQFLGAFALCSDSSIIEALNVINDGLNVIHKSTQRAMAFAFGGLADSLQSEKNGIGFILALQGLPMLITISAISSLLIYWRILPNIIKIFSILFKKIMNIGGTLGIGVATNMFAGMSETPLIIKHYLHKFNRNELFTLMVCGTAGTSGTVMVIYSIIVGGAVENMISHIITAALLNIPAAIGIAKIIVPSVKGDTSTEGDDANFEASKSTIDAIYNGIVDGAKVIVNIIIMIVGFVALIDVLNQILAMLPEVGGKPLVLQRILGWILTPLALLIGIPWEEAAIAGASIGTKITMNELVGFQQFAHDAALMSERTKIIVVYALCGFANISSIGIMAGVYSSLAPERKNEVMSLGPKAVFAGTLANCMTASLAGSFYFL